MLCLDVELRAGGEVDVLAVDERTRDNADGTENGNACEGCTGCHGEMGHLLL